MSTYDKLDLVINKSIQLMEKKATELEPKFNSLLFTFDKWLTSKLKNS